MCALQWTVLSIVQQVANLELNVGEVVISLENLLSHVFTQARNWAVAIPVMPRSREGTTYLRE